MELSSLITLASEFGFAAALVVITLWGVWRYIIPALINRWDEAERARTQREQAMHEYYRTEIRSLQNESRSDKIKLLDAFQENTLTMSKTNDLLCMLAKQLEEQGKDIEEIKKYIYDKER